MRRAPLIDSARSSIEVIPNFVARNSAAFGSNPFPSSATNRLIMASLELSSTSIRLACECFSALLSASWAIRYTSRSTAGGGRAALLELYLHGIHAPQDLNVFAQRRNQSFRVELTRTQLKYERPHLLCRCACHFLQTRELGLH